LNPKGETEEAFERHFHKPELITKPMHDLQNDERDGDFMPSHALTQ
jgi:hypothetical protein